MTRWVANACDWMADRFYDISLFLWMRADKLRGYDRTTRDPDDESYP